jgi:3'(2'), 5'-bisphosphate nucleotidase
VEDSDERVEDSDERVEDSDERVAAELAWAAGELLEALRRRAGLYGPALGALADRLSHQALSSALAEQRPRDAVLSEEQRDDPTRLTQSRVWIIDPLDGTREYAAGLDEFAVHVALCEDGVPVAAAIALPARGELHTGHLASGNGSPREGRPVEARAPAAERLRIAVSRSRPPAQARAVADTLGAELVPLGSAGFKTAAVLRGEVDAYLHDGGQFEWDSAAPVAVALAAGLHASRIDGSPLRYNRPDPRLPDLLICRPEVAPTLLRELAR